MDVFLIEDGVVQNIVLVESLEQAEVLFPLKTVVERTEENQHIQIGDTWT